MKKGQNSTEDASLRQKAEEQIKKKHIVKVSSPTVHTVHTTRTARTARTEQSRSEQSRSEQSRSEQSRIEQPTLSQRQIELVEKSKRRSSEMTTMKLLHELEVHQVELEMQNEELKTALEKAATATALYDFAPAVYFTLRQNGVICELNFGGAKLLGKERSNLVNTNFKQFVTRDTLPDFNDFFPKVFETNFRQTCKVWLAIHGNSFLFVHLEAIISYDIQKCLVTAIDITDLKRAEEALKESENRFKQVTDCSHVWIWEVDAEGIYTYISAMEENFLGYKPEELIGKKYFYDFFSPDKKNELAKAAFEVFSKKGYFTNFENPNIHKDGRLVILETSGIPLLDKQGLLLGYRGADRDITDRKRAEEQLWESEERFHSLFENATIGLYRTSPDGHILMANPTAIRLLGYNSFEELAQRNLEKEGFEPDFSRNQFRQRIEQEGEVRGLESAWTRHDGSVVFVRESAKAFRNADGTILYYEGTIEDITERKLAEEALRESEARLRELNATKDKFFSIIAHDLRNPFNSIIGFSNLLSRQFRENDYEGIAKYAKIIQLSSERALSLIVNLLDWARSQTGSIEFNPEYVEIVALINEVTDLYNDSAQQKSITISRKLPHNAIVFADKFMISTVLRNLISNAVKFTHPGGNIVVSAEQNQNELLVTISDDGVGIKKHNIQKLFRIDESYSTIGTHNEKGTGLGLILCKEFVEKHKGKIWVETDSGGHRDGKGSKFCFTIPNSKEFNHKAEIYS